MVKIVGSCIYAHKTNVDELLRNIKEKDDCDFVLTTMEQLSFSYEVIKFDKNTKKVSFIESWNWDSANEPDVGTSYCFSKDGIMKIIKPTNKIYHNKWMFVASDYQGFDIEQAKRRTTKWNSIPDIKQYKSKIGNKDFWERLLKENHMEI